MSTVVKWVLAAIVVAILVRVGWAIYVRVRDGDHPALQIHPDSPLGRLTRNRRVEMYAARNRAARG